LPISFLGFSDKTKTVFLARGFDFLSATKLLIPKTDTSFIIVAIAMPKVNTFINGLWPFFSVLWGPRLFYFARATVFNGLLAVVTKF